MSRGGLPERMEGQRRERRAGLRGFRFCEEIPQLGLEFKDYLPGSCVWWIQKWTAVTEAALLEEEAWGVSLLLTAWG